MSQSDLILAALLRGERLTKLDCFKMGAGLSINSRIADLRKQGYVIPCEVEIRNGKRVWVYHMVDWHKHVPEIKFTQGSAGIMDMDG